MANEPQPHTPHIVMADKQGQYVHAQTDVIQYIGLWPDGQMNIFNVAGMNNGMHKMDAEMAEQLFSMLMDDPAAKGDNEFVELSMGSHEAGNFEYSFLYNTKYIDSFTVEAPHQGQFDRHKDKGELFTVDGQSFGIPFTPTAEQRERFLALVDHNDKDWITMSPDAAAPFNTTKGEFHIRKSAITNVAGYLLGNAIFDLDNGARIFVPIPENPARTQHVEIAKNIDTLKPLGWDRGGYAYVNPEHFDPDEVHINIFDLGKGPASHLLIYPDRWHIPFASTEDAVAALEEFVHTHMNRPDFKFDTGAAKPEDNDNTPLPDGP